MKILAITAALNLDYPQNATPAVWQLFKALYEEGCDIISIPYRGESVRSLWWRCYDNPAKFESDIYSKLLHKNNSNVKKERLVPRLARSIVRPKWKKRLSTVLTVEKEVDAVLFIGVPINHLNGLPSYIRNNHSIPVLFYDLDAPTSLPEYGGFTFSYYLGADLSEFDAIITTSDGSNHKIEKMGAQRTFTLHFGVDPDVYSPVSMQKQDIDVFFLGGTRNREQYIDFMMMKPAEKLNRTFMVAGDGFSPSTLGKVQILKKIVFNSWRFVCARSKINLSIVRENHAKTYGTSVSRPFELAAMESCIVSSPHDGIEKWFEVGKEVLVVNNLLEALEVYNSLLDDEETRISMGKRARERVLKEHTSRHRARSLMQILNNIRR